MRFRGQGGPFAQGENAPQRKIDASQAGPTQNVPPRVAPGILRRNGEGRGVEPLLRGRIRERGVEQDIRAIDPEVSTGVARIAVVGRKLGVNGWPDWAVMMLLASNPRVQRDAPGIRYTSATVARFGVSKLDSARSSR